MNWFFSLAQPFVRNPAIAIFVALGWLLIGFVLPRPARRPLFVASIGWGVFALLELVAWKERAHIRVNLVIAWPALCLLTLVCLVVAVRRVLGRGASEGREAA